MKTYQAGIDVGSTTVKLVVLDENGQMIFGQYQRHLSHTQRALSDLLKQARAALGECALELRATGSGAINLAKALGIPFVQEVVAVAQALEADVSSALQNARKFEVLTRSDLPEAMKEADFGDSGNSAGGAVRNFKGADYILTVKINDFQDYVKTADFKLIGKSAQKRLLRMGAVANIIDARTGAIAESANISVSESEISERDAGVRESSKLDRRLLAERSKSLAAKIAARATEVAFPAKVVAKTGSLVTVNRGDGTDIAVGDVYEVYASSGDLIDPATGENLGTEDVPVGREEITAVRPKFSLSRAVKDNGIARGHVLRKVEAGGEARESE